MHFKIKKGLDIPLKGEPEQIVEEGRAVSSVALLGRDYVGARPAIQVAEGDRVKLGQVLFSDKRNPGVLFTSPGSGTVKSINRGARRALESIEVELSGDEEETFQSWSPDQLPGLNRDQVKEALITSGLWTSFRTRPFSKVPSPESQPSSIFVTAIDTNPLAARPEVVIDPHREDFATGLSLLPVLTEGKVFVCKRPGVDIPVPKSDRIVVAEFAGPHPAGLVGTHVHFLDPVSAQKSVWHIGYQDVIALAKLFTTGRLWTERTVALGGSVVNRPRLVRTRVGANLEDLLGDDIERRALTRIVSGSLLSGHQAVGRVSFLGRYHNQVCGLVEGGRASFRAFLGWLAPGPDRYSMAHIFVSSFAPSRTFALNTLVNGEKRALFPYGCFEEVVPLDILPTQLLRSLVIQDTDGAQALGALELDEEDLALCSFTCPSKYDYGPFLRANLEMIEKEG